MVKKSLEIVSVTLLLHCLVGFSCISVVPEQIHISIGDAPTDIVVTWVTFMDTKNSFVWYGKIQEGLVYRAEGGSTTFKVKKHSKRVRHVHRVTICNLDPCASYAYRCGSWYGASEEYVFRVSSTNPDANVRVIMYGDMGWQGAKTFPFMLKEAKNSTINAVIHVGDIAYNLETNDGVTGDRFMNMIQPLATIVPYMTTVGNHEQFHNFSSYKNLFSMPGDTEGLYYSFNLGPIHFVAISSEVYYFTNYGLSPLRQQCLWLQRDLWMAANNRDQRPWIVVLSHRPLYCSSDDGEDCSNDRNILRCCIFNSCNYGLEDLFQMYRVDIIVSGHMHYYERSWPLYNQQAFVKSCSEPYRNAPAAVHIITGAAGMKGGTESVSHVRSDWFAFYSGDHSYTTLTAINRSALLLQQISADKKGKVIDEVWFVKDYW